MTTYPLIVVGHVPNEQEFSQVFRNLYSRLCLFAFRIVQHQTAAEDIVQDCFVSLWDKRVSLNWDKDITGYLYSMVRFSCFHYVRDHKKAPTIADEVEIADEHNALLYMIEAETLQEIFTAIDLLPGKCGNIFRDLFVAGKSIAEVSVSQNVTESTVRSHKAAALAILKGKLGVSG